MDISHLTPAFLTELLETLEAKLAIEAKLKDVNAALSVFQAAKASKTAPIKAEKPVVAPQKPKAAKKKMAASRIASPVNKSGSMKDRVTSILKAAGSEGVSVADIAFTLSIPVANLHVWFSTTGKKETSIQKVGRGRYAWKVAGKAVLIEQPAAKQEEPTIVTPVKSVAVVEEPPAPIAAVIIEEAVVVVEEVLPPVEDVPTTVEETVIILDPEVPVSVEPTIIEEGQLESAQTLPLSLSATPWA